MARIISVTFETATQGRAGAFTIPRAAANVLGLGPDDPVELRVTWEGARLELATQLRSGWEVYPRTSDPTTSELGSIPAKTAIVVTVWRGGEVDSDEPSEPDVDPENGWWGQDGGADFESRLSPEDVAPRRILGWARELAADDVVRLYSYHNADGSVFTLLPYLKQHDAGLITVWNSGRVSLFRSVFANYAPESIGRIEELLGKPMTQKPIIAPPDEAMLSALREAYVAAADVPSERAWSDERFDSTFLSAVGSTDLLDKLREWAAERDISLRYGAGKASGPLHFDVSVTNANVTLISVGATGGIEWVFRNNLDQAGSLRDREARVELVRQLRTLFGVERPDERADTWFGVNASSLNDADHDAFFAVLDGQLAQLRQAPTELPLRYQRLFTQVIGRFQQLRPSITSTTHAGPQNWLQFSAGRTGFVFSWSTAYRKYFRTELYIDVGDQDRNKAYLEALQSRGEELERAIGQPVSWERLDAKRASRLAVYHAQPGEDFDSNAELIEWAAQTMARMVDVLRPIVREL